MLPKGKAQSAAKPVEKDFIAAFRVEHAGNAPPLNVVENSPSTTWAKVRRASGF